MKYREIGKTGIRVSVVGFGGMRFFRKDKPTAMATVRKALECGITLFETGVYYGNGRSEEWIGEALKQSGVRRGDVVLANKAGVSHLPDGGEVRKALEEALRRERTDYFDLFSFWGCNTREMFENLFRPGGPLEVVEAAREKGWVRAVGITTHAQPELILEFANAFHWDCVTLKEHMLYSRQQEVIRALGNMGTGVIVMSPLAGGVAARPGPEIRRKLEAAGTSGARLGLRFLIANPCVSSAISGMTTPEEVVENTSIGDLDGPLTSVEQALVAFVQESTRALEKPFCTSCGYCLPCPQEVNIPGIFRLWNIMRGYGNAEYSRLEYRKLQEQRHWADFSGRSAEHCIACGLCETRCPERLPIIEDLQRAHRDLSGP